MFFTLSLLKKQGKIPKIFFFPDFWFFPDFALYHTSPYFLGNNCFHITITKSRFGDLLGLVACARWVRRHRRFVEHVRYVVVARSSRKIQLSRSWKNVIVVIALDTVVEIIRNNTGQSINQSARRSLLNIRIWKKQQSWMNPSIQLSILLKMMTLVACLTYWLIVERKGLI